MRFAAYPEYIGSGVDWLGSMPQGWRVAPLKSVALSVARGLSPDYVDSSSVPVISQACIQHDGLHLDAAKYHRDSASPPARGVLAAGDVLVNSTGTGTLGRVVAFQEAAFFVADGHVTVVRPDATQCHYQYLKHLLSIPMYQGFIYAALTAGSTNQIELSRDGLRGAPVLVPPLPEQQAIAAFLDRETGRIDALVARKQRLLELLEEKRTALISHAVTRGLNPHAPLKDTGIEWLGQIPEHWEVLPLRRVIAKFVDYRGKTPTKSDSGVTLVTARNVSNGKLDMGLSQEFIPEEDYDAWMVRGFPELGDVLITTEAPLGQPAQIIDTSVALAQRLILLKCDKQRVANDFLTNYLISTAGQGELYSRATGSTAIGIKAWRLREIGVVVPPLSEQVEITRHLAAETAQFEALTAKVREAIKHLQEYRTALISAAVTGKIDVRGVVGPPAG